MPGLDFYEIERRKRAKEDDSQKATAFIIPAKLAIQPSGRAYKPFRFSLNQKLL